MDSLTGSETSPVEEAIAVTLENLQETEPELVDGKVCKASNIDGLIINPDNWILDSQYACPRF